MIFYFSGTGNSKWIAERLSEVQNEQLVFIPEVMRSNAYEYELSDGEKIGFVFPIYSWGPPQLVLQFIKKLVLKNFQSKYFFFVCSCGDDIGLAQQLFCRAVEKRGWKCNSGFSVIMPNNYVLLPGFDVDSKEVELRKLEAVIDRLKEVNEAIAGKRNLFDCHKGCFPFIKTQIINPIFVKKGIATNKFHVTDNCISCKRCENICPMDNIVLKEGKPVWGTNCTSCLVCYHICPQNAIQYGKVTKKKGQYLNPDLLIARRGTSTKDV